MRILPGAVAAVLLLAVLAGCATPVRKAGGLAASARVEGRPADGAEEACRVALARLEKRRPYLAGEIFHGLDPIPLVVFLAGGEGSLPFTGEIAPFAGGPRPQVEYVVRIAATPPRDADAPLTVSVTFFARYDAAESDADAYDAALAAFRDRISRALHEELTRAGESHGVTWTSGAE